jgi:hypothetical protein
MKYLFAVFLMITYALGMSTQEFSDRVYYTPKK